MGNPEQHTQSVSKRRVLIVAACIAAATFVLLICAEIFLPSKPPSFFGLGFGPSSTTGFMVLLGPALAAWAFSIYVRCPDATIRNQLIAIAALLAFWLLDVIVKYPMKSDLGTSICWYLYYVPMLFVPALAFTCALRAAGFDTTKAGKTARSIAFAGSALLALFVLTNNLHHAVFSFSFDDPGWSGNYRYEWCYWLVAGWFVLLYGAFFALLFPAARKQLRPSFAPLAIIAGLAIAYSLLYILRNAHFFSTNLALTYTILIVVAVEITLATGILPSYAWYRETFYKLPFDLKVLTRNGQLAYSTAQAKPLSPETTEKITELGTLNGAAVDFRVPTNPHTLKRAYGISGGTALLSIDVSKNDARRTALKQRKEELVNASELLKRSAAIRQGLALREAERDLFEQINNSLAEKTSEINRLIDELPEDDSLESAAIRRQNLTRVKFLVAYCKRKGSLIVAEREGVSFTQEQVELVFTEAAADFRSMGIESAALFCLNEPLSPAIMAHLYDCAYDFASLAFAIKNPTLLLFGENDERCALTVRIVLQCEESRKLESSLQNFCNSLTKAGIRNCHQIEADEIAVKIKLEDSAL